MNKDHLFFAVFCIEALAERLSIAGADAFDLLTEKTDLLDDYIIKYYDVLHTQGKEYITGSLVDLLTKRGKL
jgi:hypothetical protein